MLGVIKDDAGEWGTIQENGTGDGILGAVVERRVDIGISALYSWYQNIISFDSIDLLISRFDRLLFFPGFEGIMSFNFLNFHLHFLALELPVYVQSLGKSTEKIDILKNY